MALNALDELIKKLTHNKCNRLLSLFDHSMGCVNAYILKRHIWHMYAKKGHFLFDYATDKLGQLDCESTKKKYWKVMQNSIKVKKTESLLFRISVALRWLICVYNLYNRYRLLIIKWHYVLRLKLKEIPINTTTWFPFLYFFFIFFCCSRLNFIQFHSPVD